MSSGLYSSIDQHSSSWILALSILSAILLVLILIIGRKTLQAQNKWKVLLKDAQASTLERILYDHLKERMSLQVRVDEIDNRLKQAETKLVSAKRRLGMVRYDAFEAVGGAQSFALALCDDDGNGFVVSSLVGRTDCRVYCKEIEGGTSPRNLTDEEKAALAAAIGRPGNSPTIH